MVFGNNFTQSSEAAIPGLYILGMDVAPAGDDAKISDLLPFHELKKYLPTDSVVATGGYETRGSLWAIQIVVNKDYPLTKLTMKQLDDRSRESMRYILSREGQQDVLYFGMFYPLPRGVVEQQLTLIR